jgi:hypothetical protein
MNHLAPSSIPCRDCDGESRLYLGAAFLEQPTKSPEVVGLTIPPVLGRTDQVIESASLSSPNGRKRRRKSTARSTDDPELSPFLVLSEAFDADGDGRSHSPQLLEFVAELVRSPAWFVCHQ